MSLNHIIIKILKRSNHRILNYTIIAFYDNYDEAYSNYKKNYNSKEYILHNVFDTDDISDIYLEYY